MLSNHLSPGGISPPSGNKGHLTMADLHGGYSCLTLGELAITWDTAIAVTKPEQGPARGPRQEREGSEKKNHPLKDPVT